MKIVQTINIGNETKGVAFKKRVPKAIRQIAAIARRVAGVEDVKISEEVNLFMWKNSIRNPPRRIRVEIEVKEQDNQKFAVVNYVPTESFKGLQTERQE